MPYITMKEKEDFLNDVEKAIKMICKPLKKNIQPTSSSVSHQPVTSLNMDGSQYNAAQGLIKLSGLKKEPGRDGNHHKLGRFIRAKANILIDASTDLSKLDEPFLNAFDNIPIASKWFSKTNMREITQQIDDIIFKDDIKDLNPRKIKWTKKTNGNRYTARSA